MKRHDKSTSEDRIDQRFWAKVDRRGPGECWPWRAYISPSGYGRFRVHSRRTVWQAHRWAYEPMVGPIPPGLYIDHLCRNRACVNPAHMECVTNGENVLRGVGLAAENARKTHCWRGHQLSGRNLTSNRAGARVCVECARLNSRSCRAKVRASRMEVRHDA